MHGTRDGQIAGDSGSFFFQCLPSIVASACQQCLPVKLPVLASNVWQTLSIGKSPRVPNNLIISGAVHGQVSEDCLGVVCQTVPVQRYSAGSRPTTGVHHRQGGKAANDVSSVLEYHRYHLMRYSNNGHHLKTTQNNGHHLTRYSNTARKRHLNSAGSTAELVAKQPMMSAARKRHLNSAGSTAELVA